MIRSICLLEDARCLLAYDGKKMIVLGDSPVAQSIRDYVESDDPQVTPFVTLMKEAADDFDPVMYWFSSASYFAFEDAPVAYSDSLFDTLKAKLDTLK